MASEKRARLAKPEGSAQDRLLEAAVDVFGKHGFEAATTRMIARAARVNIAAIPYYYKGKEGLYQAAVTFVVDTVKAEVESVFEEIAGQVFTPETPCATAVALLEKLLGKIVEFMVGSPQAPRVARIILREQLDPSSAYDCIFKGFMSPTIDCIATLVMHATGESSIRTAKLRALALMGQILAFRVARETMVRALNLKGYTVEEMEEIREIILKHTRGAVSLDVGG